MRRPAGFCGAKSREGPPTDDRRTEGGRCRCRPPTARQWFVQQTMSGAASVAPLSGSCFARPCRAADISYVWTREGWLYLALAIVLGPMADKGSFLNLHSRRVIGWAVRSPWRRMKRNLAIRALNMAIAFRTPPKGCIHHTDRGSQYCSHDYQKILRQHGFSVSMSGKGNCYDNAAPSRDFATQNPAGQRSRPSSKPSKQS